MSDLLIDEQIMSREQRYENPPTQRLCDAMVYLTHEWTPFRELYQDDYITFDVYDYLTLIGFAELKTLSPYRENGEGKRQYYGSRFEFRLSPDVQLTDSDSTGFQRRLF